MRLRVFFEGLDYFYMLGVFFRRCFWIEMYVVDLSFEILGFCVL